MSVNEAAQRAKRRVEGLLPEIPETNPVGGGGGDAAPSIVLCEAVSDAVGGYVNVKFVNSDGEAYGDAFSVKTITRY